MMTMIKMLSTMMYIVPALSSDVLMAAVVRLLPFTPDPPVPKLRVQVFAFVKLSSFI